MLASHKLMLIAAGHQPISALQPRQVYILADQDETLPLTVIDGGSLSFSADVREGVITYIVRRAVPTSMLDSITGKSIFVDIKSNFIYNRLRQYISAKINAQTLAGYCC